MAPQIRTAGQGQIRALLIASTAIAVGAIFAIRWFLPAFRIVGGSNAPTLLEGDVVMAVRKSSRFKNGNFLVFSRFGHVMVKRVIGLPGQRVEIRAGSIVIDGKPIAGDGFEIRRTRPEAVSLADVRLGPDEYFVIGDNPPDSTDSRMFGPIPGKAIQGAILLRIWPRPRIFG